jgi:hypothetical protein
MTALDYKCLDVKVRTLCVDIYPETRAKEQRQKERFEFANICKLTLQYEMMYLSRPRVLQSHCATTRPIRYMEVQIQVF